MGNSLQSLWWILASVDQTNSELGEFSGDSRIFETVTLLLFGKRSKNLWIEQLVVGNSEYYGLLGEYFICDACGLRKNSFPKAHSKRI